MDVFIFLFCGVDFLLLFLFTTVKISGDEEVCIIVKAQQLGGSVDVLALSDKSAIDQIVLGNEGVEVDIFGNLDDGLGAIELMKENLHLWQNYNYIKI